MFLNKEGTFSDRCRASLNPLMDNLKALETLIVKITIISKKKKQKKRVTYVVSNYSQSYEQTMIWHFNNFS